MRKTKMKIREVIDFLDSIAPLQTQESYDNSGLLAGDASDNCDSVLLCLDVTEDVVDEAIKSKTGLIISHHPFIFGGLKKVTGKNAGERILIKVIRHGISVYCLHTPFDLSFSGINIALARLLGLKNIRILKPAEAGLKKIVTFVPESHASQVRKAMFDADAGHIGNYDSCSFNINGQGTFRAMDGAKPFVGKKGELHTEKEVRVETIVPFYRVDKVIAAMKKVHPYEEVAYDIYPIENVNHLTGIGAIGETSGKISERNFLLSVRKKLGIKLIKHSAFKGKDVARVAVCGGSGSFLIPDAIKAGADIFVTGDVKYHQFQEAENRIVIADAGHYETEKVFLLIIFYLLAICEKDLNL